MRVRPARGLKVRHPVTKELFSDADVIEIDPRNLFWAKLLEHGDVVPADAVHSQTPGTPLAS